MEIFNSRPGPKLSKILLDKNKKMPEAFICANDNMAIGVMRKLRRRKIDCSQADRGNRF